MQGAPVLSWACGWMKYVAVRVLSMALLFAPVADCCRFACRRRASCQQVHLASTPLPLLLTASLPGELMHCFNKNKCEAPLLLALCGGIRFQGHGANKPQTRAMTMCWQYCKQQGIAVQCKQQTLHAALALAGFRK